MTAAPIAGTMSPGLAKVAERAQRDPQTRFHSLAHLIDVDLLREEFHRLRRDAAVGVDDLTVAQYGERLEERLVDLHARLREGRWRHQPIRRVQIPKDDGGTRPIGISTTEDKIVQGAVRTVLEAIYEPAFLPCSYGFRRGRSAHDALRALHETMMSGEVAVVLEADIASFFDSVDRTALMEMLQHRVADGSLLRLVGKCLHVGVLDGEQLCTPELGTAQGSVLSPLLANVYLHHVLDLWFAHEVQPRLRGSARLIRYADDFVMTFSDAGDAARVMAVLGRRMERYGLRLHPDKTRLIPMQRPPASTGGGKGPGSFDFLGFTVFWRRSLKGRWVPGMKTRRARLHRALQAARRFCRRHRHESIEVQREGLARRLNGHFNYFGVQGNSRALARVLWAVQWIWWKWLNRRSQRARMPWERFAAMLRERPLPRPTIRVRIWGPAS